MKRAFVILSFMWATPCLGQTDSTARITTGAFLVGGDLINVNGRADLLISGGKPR